MLLEDVYSALRKHDYCCMSVFEGEGTGKYNDPKNKHGSLDFPAMHTKVIKIEIAAKEDDVKPIIQIIKTHAHTGRKGDGLVFVSPVEYATRIRDDKEGAEILS